MKIKLFILFFYLICFNNSFSQKERHLKTFFETSYREEAHYFNISKDNSISHLDSILTVQKFIQYISEFQKENDSEYGIDTFGIIPLHLNNDEYIDIVYESGFGLLITEFFFGSKTNFNKVLSGHGLLKDLKYDHNTCTQIVLFSPIYVGSYISEQTYHLDNFFNYYSLFNLRQSYECVEPAQLFFDAPLKAITISQETPLYENPRDTTSSCVYDFEEKELKNNIISHYKKNSLVNLWAKTFDNKKQCWYLVEISDRDEIASSNTEYILQGFNEFFIGWIKEKDLLFLK